MKREFLKYSCYIKKGALLALLALPASAFAAGPPQPSEVSDPLTQVLLVVIVSLLLAIGLLANVVMGAAQVYLQRKKAEKKEGSATITKVLTVLALCMLSTAAFAADEPQAATSHSMGSLLSETSLFTMMGVIAIELIVIFYLLYYLQRLLKKEIIAVAVAGEAMPAKESKWKKFWENANSFKPMKEEAGIDLGHDYDGIRELDNKLPPWWLYMFYGCILFAGIYLWRYHVSHSAPLPAQELQEAMAKAEIAKQEYLKNAANNVDESTVKMLTAENDLEAGKKIFTTVCAACHGADGGGSVGPNLTDDYWLHGGSIQDIFKTVKYGWQDKGMKSWKDDYSAAQIAQIASYVKSLHGTKPKQPKEPQGELWKDDAAKAAPDSSAVQK